MVEYFIYKLIFFFIWIFVWYQERKNGLLKKVISFTNSILVQWNKFKFSLFWEGGGRYIFFLKSCSFRLFWGSIPSFNLPPYLILGLINFHRWDSAETAYADKVKIRLSTALALLSWGLAIKLSCWWTKRQIKYLYYYIFLVK